MMGAARTKSSKGPPIAASSPGVERTLKSIEKTMVAQRPSHAAAIRRWFTANQPMLSLIANLMPAGDQTSRSVVESLPAATRSVDELLMDLQQSAQNAGLYGYDSDSKAHYLRKAATLRKELSKRFESLERPATPTGPTGVIERTARKLGELFSTRKKKNPPETLTDAQRAAIPLDMALLPSRDWARNTGASAVGKAAPTRTFFPDLPESSVLRTQAAQKALHARQREGFAAYVAASPEERRQAFAGKVTEFFPEYPYSDRALKIAEGWLLAFRAARQSAGSGI